MDFIKRNKIKTGLDNTYKELRYFGECHSQPFGWLRMCLCVCVCCGVGVAAVNHWNVGMTHVIPAAIDIENVIRNHS